MPPGPAPLRQVAIVGGGPVGLALAIHLARRGVDAVLFERQRYPVDKACGEGLMPSGVALLQQLGVGVDAFSPADHSRFVGIRYVQEDGSSAEGAFGEGRFGLGIRRTALSAALVAQARAQGAEVRDGEGVRGWQRSPAGVQLQTDGGPVQARLLVAADGLNSAFREGDARDVAPRTGPGPILERTGLRSGGDALPRQDPLAPSITRRPSSEAGRYGLRRHFQLTPWTDRVEVHFAPDMEAYVTPVGERRVGVAFLWTRRRAASASFEGMLAQFPKLAERLAGVEHDSTVRGAGPLEREVPCRVRDRLVLLGDAAGYVDAITGEGLTLGFRAAAALALCLPEALAAGLPPAGLDPYERAATRDFTPYARMTRTLLWLAHRPELRKRVVRTLGRAPWLFNQVLRRVA